MARVVIPTFDDAHLKKFQSTFNFREFVSTRKKSGNFTEDIVLFKNPSIWFANDILAYMSGIRFFPSMEFVQEHSK